MKQFDNKNYVNNLPDKYAKGTDSNNYKLLLIEKNALIAMETDISDIEDALDIDRATGETLNLYGDMLEQPRGLATDAQYRLLIKSKIAQNLSTGSFPSVIKCMSLMFNCDPSEIVLVEGENPCELKLEGLPLAAIVNADMTASQAVSMIKRLMPSGVSLASFLFEGTFEFGTAESEESTTAGFSDDNGTIGGYFGITSGEENEAVLPI